MSKKLTASFEPYNQESMVNDYYSICNQLEVAIRTLNNGRDNSRKKQLLNLVNSLMGRKEGLERQFNLENIEYKKR